ncbi:GNAT family N-acetyltransferase [Sediminispirochaeta bajacaliforniensis]|uniref:GNAT family N-acetyltransferase n=1 Tax=Sediminispirochaeta bajacaliforniensis TaxID=148 RepID=UPI00037D6349|nr:GNAT family N-acetyltransferase [Sediminispirochaeta bajacaliforniensis]
MVDIIQATNNKMLKEFIRFPFTLYYNHPCWVPPLFFDEWNTLHWKRNAAYSYCESRFFLAKREGKTVGRIAAIRNDRFIEKWKHRYIRFGWVDFIDDPEVSQALFAAVESWAEEQGMEGIHGPLGFTDLDPEGLLTQGFEEEGTLPMIYNYDYYPRHIEALGYHKDVDWLQFEIPVPKEIGPKFTRLKKVVLERNELRLVQAKRRRDLLPHARGIFEVINRSYAQLYGVVELNDEQIDAYVRQYFGFVNPDFVKIILNEKDEVIAFAIAMPRLSSMLIKHRGRLFPLGALALLHTLRKPTELVFYLLGIRPDYQVKGLTSILMTELYRECIDYGITRVQTCGELENNSNIVTLMNNFEHRQHIRRRCYIKTWK